MGNGELELSRQCRLLSTGAARITDRIFSQMEFFLSTVNDKSLVCVLVPSRSPHFVFLCVDFHLDVWALDAYEHFPVTAAAAAAVVNEWT